jgi:radical SAM superfamily enzyme YgiQ (UPF0313 family)
VEDILNELEKIPQKAFAFIDDNLIGYSQQSKKRAEELFKGMIERKLNKYWGCQASINFVDDEHLLSLAAKSGCCVVLIGLESINQKALSGFMNKKLNTTRGVDYYYEVTKKLHKYGILLIGNMIFCNDEDDLAVFTKTIDFISKSEVDIPWPGVVTPYPGTTLYKRLFIEDRLLYKNYPDDWAKYIITIPLKPKNCDVTTFYNTYINFIRDVFSYYKILKRSFKTLCHTKSLFKTLITYNFNQSLKKRYEQGFLAPTHFLH